MTDKSEFIAAGIGGVLDIQVFMGVTVLSGGKRKLSGAVSCWKPMQLHEQQVDAGIETGTSWRRSSGA